MSESKKRDIIDYLKAGAIFLVVLGHCITHYREMGHMVSNGQRLFEELIYSVHVPLFFMISGYLCHRQPIAKYYLKKLERIFIPFIFFSILKLIYTNLISASYGHAADLKGQLFDAFVLGELYWFAYAILVIMLVMPLFWQKNETDFPIKAFVGAVVFVILDIFIELNPQVVLPLHFQIRYVVVYIPFFLLGHVMRYLGKRLFKFEKSKRILLIAISLAGIVVLVGVIRRNDYYNPFYVKFVLAFLLSYLLFLIAYFLPEKVRLIKLIGKYSWQIMLLDSFFKAIIYIIAELFLELSFAAAIAIAVVDVALGLITCVLADKIDVKIIKKLMGL